MGKGSGGTQTTTTNANPWSGAQPYLREGLHNLQQIYETGGATGPATIDGVTYAGAVHTPDYYPNSTVAPMSPWTAGALTSQAWRGATGSPVTAAAQDQTTATLRGDYFDNPHLTAAINYATSPVEAAVNSAFSSAGRYGSGAQVDALSRGVGDIASNMAFQNYNAERGRQQQAAAMAVPLANQDYFDINQMGASGSALDAFNQALIDQDIQRWNYGQDSDWQRTMQFLQAIQGAAPFGSTSQTQMPRPDPFSSALGTAASGAGLLGALFGFPLF